VLTAAIPFPNDYSVERRLQALDRMVARLQSRPGVTHTAVSTALPLASAGGFTFFTFPSPLRDGATIEVESIRRVVTPPYFGALGIRVRAGRPLTAADHPDAPPAVVVNRSFVRKYLDDIPIEQAVGLSLGLAAVRGTTVEAPATIVGVVDDVLQGRVDGTPQPEMFVSLDQLRGVNHGSPAYVLSNTLAPYLYGVPATDWLSFGAAPLALLAAGLAAAVVPALRVARVDPLAVLREG